MTVLHSHCLTSDLFCIPTPSGPGESDEHADLFVHPSVLQTPGAEGKIDEIWKFYDDVNQQDIDACELVQV